MTSVPHERRRPGLARRHWPRVGAAVSGLPVPLLVIDEALTVLQCTPSAAALLGRTPAEVVGRPVGMILPGAEPPAADAVETLQLLPGDQGLVATWAWSFAAGRVTGVVVLDDSSGGRRADLLAHAAEHDPLTGLLNRTALHARLEELVAGGEPLAVLFLDLDRFKVVNDSLGHETGDRLLLEVARRLTTAVRPGDLVARFGGDEFVVVCPQVASVGQATAVARRTLTELAVPVTLDAVQLRPVGSVGIAVSSGDDDAAGLLRNADTALYRAKERGGDRFVIFDPALRAEAQRRLSLEVGLRAALDAGGVTVVFQPIFEIPGRRMVGAELLARWEHPELGPVSPAEFVPLAEETGMILDLGRLVMRAGCRELALLQAELGPQAPYVSVNVSGSQFALPGFVEAVTGELALAGADGSGLVVEVTEGVLLGDSERVGQTMTGLRELGVRIALDDFGTGHSSMSYLHRFPVDIVKIDRTFISAVNASPPDRAIVAAVVGLAAALGLDTVAEGIEDVEVEQALLTLGCRHAQGYLYARPMPAGELEALAADGAGLVRS